MLYIRRIKRDYGLPGGRDEFIVDKEPGGLVVFAAVGGSDIKGEGHGDFNLFFDNECSEARITGIMLVKIVGPSLSIYMPLRKYIPWILSMASRLSVSGK